MRVAKLAAERPLHHPASAAVLPRNPIDRPRINAALVQMNALRIACSIPLRLRRTLCLVVQPYIDDAMGYHAVGNPFNDSAITLHVYSKNK